MTEFKDTSKNNEETDIELQPIANTNVSDSKNDDIYVLNNRKYVFPYVSYVSILKLPGSTKRSSNIPAYVPPQIASPIFQVSESELAMTQGDLLLLETLETLQVKASANIKFVDDSIKGSLSPSEITVLEKKSGFSPTPPSISEADLCRDVSVFAKIRCKLYFRNERQKNASETPEFNVKSTQNLPKGLLLLNSF